MNSKVEGKKNRGLTQKNLKSNEGTKNIVNLYTSSPACPAYPLPCGGGGAPYCGVPYC